MNFSLKESYVNLSLFSNPTPMLAIREEDNSLLLDWDNNKLSCYISRVISSSGMNLNTARKIFNDILNMLDEQDISYNYNIEKNKGRTAHSLVVIAPEHLKQIDIFLQDKGISLKYLGQLTHSVYL